MEVAWCSDHGLPHSALLEWSAEDRAKLMAHLMDAAARCSGCGTLQDEWEEDRFAYEVMTVLCHGCAIKEAGQDQAPEIPGAKVTLVPALTAERMRSQPKRIPGRR